MSTRNVIAAATLVLSFGAGAALAQSPGLGKPLTEADILQWDIAIMPDGSNLPPGSGTPAKGAKIFAEKCSACHGDAAKGGVAPFYPSLVGGQPLTNGIDTVKTIANYYAYPTTIFDYTRRGMPYNMPRSLTDDEVYSLTAY
ncbi:MAG TPA: cytochrome c, partial [Xanthobacteraceae bacterium]|nr:cytochrome c [Xanthobacteraceae bacterium]